jgi:hypothetical protein
LFQRLAKGTGRDIENHTESAAPGSQGQAGVEVLRDPTGQAPSQEHQAPPGKQIDLRDELSPFGSLDIRPLERKPRLLMGRLVGHGHIDTGVASDPDKSGTDPLVADAFEEFPSHSASGKSKRKDACSETVSDPGGIDPISTRITAFLVDRVLLVGRQCFDDTREIKGRIWGQSGDE